MLKFFWAENVMGMWSSPPIFKICILVVIYITTTRIVRPEKEVLELHSLNVLNLRFRSELSRGQLRAVKSEPDYLLPYSYDVKASRTVTGDQ